MNKCCMHQKFYVGCKSDCNLLTYSIHTSEINNFDRKTNFFELPDGRSHQAFLECSESKFKFGINTNKYDLKCSVSMFIGSETCLYSNNLSKPTRVNPPDQYFYELIILTSTSECFQKLKQLPNDTLFLVCQIINPPSKYSVVPTTDTSMDSFNYLKTLGAALKNSPGLLSQDKVVLKVGEETETVSKSMLCAVSPLFTKMFQNDMKESKDNLVIITDISMPVLKALVSFLYSGMLPKFEFDFLCDLYYAADKYNITELCNRCVDLLLPQISKHNIFKALKLAFSHNIEWLKSVILSLISTNIETLASTSDWRNFMDDEPKIAVGVLQQLQMIQTFRADLL